MILGRDPSTAQVVRSIVEMVGAVGLFGLGMFLLLCVLVHEPKRVGHRDDETAWLTRMDVAFTAREWEALGYADNDRFLRDTAIILAHEYTSQGLTVGGLR